MDNYQIKTPLLKHQSSAVDLIANKTYYAMLWECGCGKTLGVIAIIACRKQRFPKYRTLVVCPSTLLENWQEEIDKHSNLSSVLLVGSKDKRIKLLSKVADIYIINYEGLRVIEDKLKYKFNLIVFDESQNLKQHTSLQSKAGYAVAKTTPHRLILTGTPIYNHVLDIFGQYRVLSDNIFGSSFRVFRAKYALMGGYMGKQVITAINTEDLSHKMSLCSDMKTKDQVLDLPPRVYETVRVDLPDEQVKVYKQLKTEFLAMFNNKEVTGPVIVTRLMRFSQITAGFIKNIDGDEEPFKTNPKLDWLIDWLNEHKHKVVIFVRFLKEIAELEGRLKKNGTNFVSIYGAITDRQSLVNKFNSDPDCRVFIGQIDTASAGINLQSASYCIFLSNSYSYGDREQAESRIHRQGQKAKSCTYIDVIARDTIDERILKVLRSKQSVANMLVADLKEVV